MIGVPKNWNKKMTLLPIALRGKILQKKHLKDIQLSVSGKLLLMQVLKEFDLPLSLSNLEYHTHHRPFFKAGFDFNIAHSGNMVICCGTTNGKVGADIERIQPINFNNYTDYFTGNEWQNILNSDDPTNAFLNFWTRKEAVLKAAGTGFFTPLQEIDVTDDILNYDNCTYYLHQLTLHNAYQCHIAATVEQDISTIAVKHL